MFAVVFRVNNRDGKKKNQRTLSKTVQEGSRLCQCDVDQLVSISMVRTAVLALSVCLGGCCLCGVSSGGISL